MTCCSAKGCDEFFGERVARRDAARYRRRGIDGNVRRVVDFVCGHGIEGSTVLEVGGGVGAIQLELLQAGAARAENVELSPAYEPYAAELLLDAGLEGRVERRLLDFAVQAEEVQPADVVVLHKVVCCYPTTSRWWEQPPLTPSASSCSPSRAIHGGCDSESAPRT
jgi:hypothetical protein